MSEDSDLIALFEQQERELMCDSLDADDAWALGLVLTELDHQTRGTT